MREVTGAVDRMESGVTQRGRIPDVVHLRRHEHVALTARPECAEHSLGPPRYPNRVAPSLRQVHKQPLREVTGTVNVSGGPTTGHATTDSAATKF